MYVGLGVSGWPCRRRNTVLHCICCRPGSVAGQRCLSPSRRAGQRLPSHSPLRLSHSLLSHNPLSSGVPAAPRLLEKPGTYQRSHGSWDLILRYPYQKLKSLRILPTIFGSGQILWTENQTSNVRGSMSGLNRIFTGEIPQ